MPKAIEFTIVAAHLSVYLVVALNIWVFSSRSYFYTNVLKLRSLPLIYFGFGCKAIATSYEIAEHIGDKWLYVSHISDLNRLFYTFLTAGTCLIAMGLKKSKLTDLLSVLCLVSVPILYGVGDSKTLIQWPQLVATIIFVYHWYIIMRDWRIFLYPVLSNVVALGLGIALIVSKNQIFHIFIGPASGLGLLLLGYVAWVQPLRKKYLNVGSQNSR